MRVIAGDLRGRQLVAPKGWQVRPTSGRVREAVFSALGAVAGANVLDLYCGTGALAIEALSRGAATATMIDRDTRPALGNVHLLGLDERVNLIRADVPDWLVSSGVGDGLSMNSFDLVFCDAPYKLADRLAPELENQLPRLLSEGGRVIVESPARRPLALSAFEQLRERRYGGTSVSFYRVAP